MADEVGLFGKGVDGVDDGIVFFKIEFCGSGTVVDHSEGIDVEMGIDVEETFLECLHLRTADVRDGGHYLTVDVGYVHTVRIDDGEMSDAAAYQAFGTPAAHAPNPEDDDAALLQTLQRLVAEEEGGTAEKL